VPDPALALIARSAEGSMRDAQSALDQVIAFAGTTITADDVATVLGLVGRDLLFELIEAVIAEDGPRAFALTDRAVESGHDLRLIIRELSKVVRDLMMVMVDPARAGEGDLAEGEIERLTTVAKQFSREDLMRAFELLAKAEQDIRTASHPRYHIEMLLLRWMHLRKLVPLMDLLEGGSGGAPIRREAPPTSSKLGVTKTSLAPASDTVAPTRNVVAPVASKPAPVSASAKPESDTVAPVPTGLKDKFLAEIRSGKNTLYNIAIAQALRIDVTDERITFTFAANQNVARGQLDQNREWLETVAQRLAGRRIQVTSAQVQAETGSPAGPAKADAASAVKRDLKAEALSSSGVQAMLDVFPAEIRDVEEM
jgi:DNA polymerase-3 subunit gamma/tau